MDTEKPPLQYLEFVWHTEVFSTLPMYRIWKINLLSLMYIHYP